MTAIGFITGVVSMVDDETLTKSHDLQAYAPGLQTGVGALAVNRDGTMIAVGPTIHPDHAPVRVADAPADQMSNGLKIWRLTDHVLLSNDQDARPVRQIDWSPTGDAIVAARDTDVAVKSVGSQRNPAVAHLHGDTTARFTDDGSVVAFAKDNQIMLYDLLHK